MLRLTLGRHRWELIAMAVMLLAVSGLAVWLAVTISRLDIQTCLAAFDHPSAHCRDVLATYQQAQSLMPALQVGAVFAPPLAGFFLGAPFVAREIEDGTAVFAWSFAGARTRWLLTRVLIVLVPLAVLSLVVGSSVDAVYAAALPQVSIDHILVDYQIRGPVVMGHAVLAFAASLFVGALVGRLLPSLLLAAALSVALIGGAMYLADTIDHRDPVVSPPPGSLLVYSLYRLPDGRVVGADALTDAEWEQQLFEAIDYGIPGDRAVLLVSRTLGIYLLVSLGLVLATAAVVERRRPY